jgi:hypothetical protein
MIWYCLLVEVVVLVGLAWIEKLSHFVVNVAAGLVALCFLALFRGDDPSLVTNLGVCGLLGFFVCTGAWILWQAVRLGRAAIEAPRAFVQALDIVAMESAIAKSLARKPSNPNSYGNRRVSQEAVRALKNRSSDD